MKKRDIFSEIIEGFDALESARAGMIPAKVRAARERLNLSQAELARLLRTELQTIVGWEHGNVEPNAQAVILLSLLNRHPALMNDIEKL